MTVFWGTMPGFPARKIALPLLLAETLSVVTLFSFALPAEDPGWTGVRKLYLSIYSKSLRR